MFIIFIGLGAYLNNPSAPESLPEQPPTNGNDDIVPPPQDDNWFPDVPRNHWAYEYIRTLTDNGAVEGYPDGTFQPDNPVTRSEFAKMMYLALELHRISDSSWQLDFQPFVDMYPDRWEYVYVTNVARYMTGFRAQDGSIHFLGGQPAEREDMTEHLGREARLRERKQRQCLYEY